MRKFAALIRHCIVRVAYRSRPGLQLVQTELPNFLNLAEPAIKYDGGDEFKVENLVYAGNTTGHKWTSNLDTQPAASGSVIKASV